MVGGLGQLIIARPVTEAAVVHNDNGGADNDYLTRFITGSLSPCNVLCSAGKNCSLM